MFEAKFFPRTPQADLNLVEQKQQIVIIGNFAKAF
jgi:hypothetical protein